MSVDVALAELACLFPEAELPGDPTGGLATIGRLLRGLKPRLLWITDDAGKVVAAESFRRGAGPALIDELAVRVAAGASLGQESPCVFETATASGPGLAFGVRVGQGRDAVLGGLLDYTHRGAQALQRLRGVLAVCGTLAWVGIRHGLEARELRTRVRHLYAEEASLRASHLEAVNAAVQEREERLLEQLRYEMVLNSAGEGLFSIDRHGTLVYVNPAGAKMLGWSPSELVGRPYHEVFCHSRQDGTPAAREESPIFQTARDGQVRRIVAERFWRRDGSSFPAQYTCTPMQDGEEVVGTVVTFADITERRMLEAQLAQAQRLESIGQLAAGIAHEINTPTQYLGDNARFLREAFGELGPLLAQCLELGRLAREGPLTPEACQAVVDAVAQADVEYLIREIPAAIDQSLDGLERVAKIVRSMKEFSHPGTEEKQAVDLNRAVESTLTVSRNEWKYVAEVVTELDPQLPRVPCLPGDLNQVLLNLIINAAHAIEAKLEGTPKDKQSLGRITVRTRRCGDWAEIDVADTGTGIQEAVRPRVFDPFFTTKKVGKGTGQGLAIARTIVVERHGGEISFQTELGRGTTFTIRLPIRGSGPSHQGKPHEATNPVCR